MPSSNYYGPIPVPDLQNWNTDRTVDVPVMLRGGMWKTSGGSWVYDTKPTSFQISTVEMATAGNDYSSLIPQDTKGIQIKVRGLEGKTVSCCMTSAVSAGAYFTMIDSQTESLGFNGCVFDSQSIWFSGDTNNTIMELVMYV